MTSRARLPKTVGAARAKGEDVLFLYDGPVLEGIVQRVIGGWRAVCRGRDLGVFKRRPDAIATIHGEGGRA
jgi:hypothetical protein